MEAIERSHLFQSPEALRQKLSLQLRSYLRQPASAKAEKIVSSLEGLLMHPDNQDKPQDRCAYLKLLWQWRVVCHD